MATHIHTGKRPSRPKDPSQSRWLPGPVWDVITTGWSYKPEKRCELSVMNGVFSTSRQLEQEVQGVEPGVLNTHNEKTPDIKTGLQKLGRFLPRIAPYFQFLRDSEPEIQKRIDEMDEVGFVTSPTLPQG